MNGTVPLKERILGGLWGSLVGDALGVPVEFMDRATVQADLVANMREFGTHDQPRGIWSECVLKAVNLGGDTDTTGCVAGGLTGVVYGLNNIPPEWIASLARKADLDCLFDKFADICGEAYGRGSQ